MNPQGRATLASHRKDWDAFATAMTGLLAEGDPR